MVKIQTVTQQNNTHTSRVQYPYGPYELFPKTGIKKATTNMIDFLLILLTLHYKRPSPATFRGVLGWSKP
jgi:hypothetical protein